MADIKLRKATGIFEYRKVVPPRLVGLLPPVVGFTNKPDRTEFTKSLATRNPKEANAAAAKIGALVNAAIAQAEKALAGRKAGSPVEAGPSLLVTLPKTSASVINPDEAYAAIDRWVKREVRAERIRYFNSPKQDTMFTAESGALNRISNALGEKEPWNKMPEFDATLVAALMSEGIGVSSDHPSIARLRPYFRSSWQDLVRYQARINRGEWIEVDEEEDGPAGDVRKPTAPSAPTSPQPKTLEQAAEEYLSDSAMRHTSMNDVRILVRRLTDFVGPHRQLETISRDELREFRDVARRLPSRPTHIQRSMSMRAQAASADMLPDSAKISDRTISKWFDFLNAIFEHAMRNENVSRNPVRGVKISKKRVVRERSRHPFSDEDLALFFGSPLFTGSLSMSRRYRGGNLIVKDAAYWVALICLYSGARLNEVGQAHIADLKQAAVADGTIIHYLDITTESGEDNAAAKGLKNQQSIRPVPLHAIVLRMGFVEYAEGLRRAGQSYLFPDLDHGRKTKPTKNLSRWYGRYFTHIGITSAKFTFHSLRHNFKDACRNAHVSKEIHDRLTGHTLGGTSEGYGYGPSIETLNAAIQKVEYPSILNHRLAT